jgi:hypothetical protein
VPKPWWLVGMALLSSSLLVGWLGGGGEARAAGNPAIVAAGDIASCASPGDEATAELLANTRGTVAALGDNAYPDGTAAQFRDCYGPSWGRFKARTKPAVGNHEYYTADAQPYFEYFGASAGPSGKGYYSYDKGSWHIVVLNSNCSEVPCAAGSAQERWLRSDLAAHPTKCTLAYFHHPRFSSGFYGNDSSVAPFWKALHEAGAEVVLNGHAHNYERFAPQRPDGTLARKRGIRQFVVGTGGVSHKAFGAVKPNSQARNADTYGVLRLALRQGGYGWKFKPVAGKAFTDSGTQGCH